MAAATVAAARGVSLCQRSVRGLGEMPAGFCGVVTMLRVLRTSNVLLMSDLQCISWLPMRGNGLPQLRLRSTGLPATSSAQY